MRKWYEFSEKDIGSFDVLNIIIPILFFTFPLPSKKISIFWAENEYLYS